MNNTIRNNIIEFGGPAEEHYCVDGLMDFESQNTPQHLSDYCSDAWNLQSALTYYGMDPNIPPPLHDSASSYSVPTNAQQDMYSSAGLSTCPHVELSFSCQQETHASRIPCGALLSFGDPAVSSVDVPQSSRTRIRWSPGLHDKFVECVNRLGGADKATPKEIVKLMNTQGLTSFHVKSHLQKYRIANQMPEPTPGKSGGSSSSSSMNDMKQLDKKSGTGLEDALELQLDVQRRLHQQLEIQRNMQLRIEEQGRQLKIMLEQQQEMQKALQEDWSRSC